MGNRAHADELFARVVKAVEALPRPGTAEYTVDWTDILIARGALQEALGAVGLVDAAGVVGLFNAIDRVADATGIPLEPGRRQRAPTFARPSISTASR